MTNMFYLQKLEQEASLRKALITFFYITGK